MAMTKLNDIKLAPVKKAGFVDEYFDNNEADMLSKMKSATNGGFDISFEVVGAESTLDTCINALKPGGTVLMIGNSITPTIPVNINRAVLQEINLIGSVSCTREEFEGTIDLIAKGVIDPEAYVTDIVTLDKLQNTFERLVSMDDPILKAVVKP